MTIHFSERLKSFFELTKGYNKRFLKEEFIDVEYIDNNEGDCSTIEPKLLDWYVTDFNER